MSMADGAIFPFAAIQLATFNAMQTDLGVLAIILLLFHLYIILIVTATTMYFSRSLKTFMLVHDFWFANPVPRQPPVNVTRDFKSGAVSICNPSPQNTANGLLEEISAYLFPGNTMELAMGFYQKTTEAIRL